MKVNRIFKVWCILVFALVVQQAHSQVYSITSPDGSLEIRTTISSDIKYEVFFHNNQLITPSAISVTLNTGLILGENAEVESTESRNVDDIITPLYGKNKEIENYFNELKINFTESYALIMRAYNEGVTYRFETALEGDVIVISEEANFNLSGSPGVIFPEADPAMQSWERSYQTYKSIADIDMSKFSITPTMFSYPESGIRVAVAESDLFDYPGMYLQRNGEGGMKGKWAQYPKTVSEPDNLYAYHRVLERENYLAETSGTRLYPWRVLIVSAEDKDLLNNELIYKLARPQVLANTSWIQPGKSAWEWWHDAILETDQVESGTNNLSFELYKYYVDFAADNQLEYITMDAGWSMDFAAQVCQYAASKNIGVFLWDFINLPVANPDRLTQLKNIGAAGIKVDLIERDDQIAINWFEQLAKDCADRELMIIFHGNAKPTGLQRAYPNIMNYEAVRGAECAKWDETPNPDYHLLFPFIRMLAGPLDYTPGSMRNVHRSEFSPTPTGIPMTMGTRVHELAMYVMFDQPLGFLCDSPTEYQKNKVSMHFLSKVPTVWDKTVPLDAEVGQYAVIAKQKGEEWYVAGMTNQEAREVEIDFSFLPENTDYRAEIYSDNDQTNIDAKAFTYEITVVNSQTKLNYQLSPGGGIAIRMIKGTITGLDKRDKAREKAWIYLNDDHSKLKVQSHDDVTSIYIIDISGKIHYQHNPAQQSLPLTVNIDALATGVYVAKIVTNSYVQSLRFIK